MIQAYLMDKKSGKLIGVNETGLFIVRMYILGARLPVIVGTYSKKFSLSWKEAKEDVNSLLGELKELGLGSRNTRVLEKRKDQLLTVQLDLSWKCNLKCKHCYLSDTSLADEPLSLKEWKKIIDQIQEMKVPKLSFLGGEPLLCDMLFPLARYASKLGFKLYTTTNAILVDKKRAEKLFDSGFNEIDVSLDGSSSETNDFIRGEGTLSKILEGINTLVCAGLEVKTATVLNKVNQYQVLDILELGKELGVSQMYFNPLLPSSGDSEFWQEYSLDFRQWAKVKQSIELWNSVNPEIPAFAESGFDIGASKAEEEQGDILCYSGCKAGKREVIITPDGYVAVCPMVSTDHRFKSMSLRKHRLEDIWKTDPWIRRLRELDETSVEGKCLSCPNKLECQGGCHILSYLEKGNLRSPDPRCPHSFD